MTGRRFQTLGVGGAIVLGAWLRCAGIGKLSLWFDEGYTAWAINHPAERIIRFIRADTAPPLYYLLLHDWSLLFGRSEIALRGFSALLGVAAIPLVAGIARRTLAQPATVVAAAWFFVLSFLQTWYSQEARGYEMGVFLTASLLYCLLGHLEEPNWKRLLLLIVSAAADLYVNNFMPLYVAAIGLAGLIFPSSMSLVRRLRDGAIAATALTLIYIPWISSLRSQLRRVNHEFWIARPKLDSLCDVLARTCGVSHFWSWDQYVHWIYYDVATGVPRAAAALLLAGIFAALIFLRGFQRRTVLGLAICALLPPCAAFVYSRLHRSIFLPAAFVPSTIAAAVLMAVPLAASRRWIAQAAVIGMLLLCAANLLAYEHERQKEDWRSAAEAVSQMPAVQRRLIVFLANEAQLPFDYYYRPRAGDVETGAPAGFFDVDPPRTQRRVLFNADLDDLRAQIQSGNFQDVILVLSHQDFADPGGRTLRLILSLTRQQESLELYKVTIWRCVP